MYSPVFTIIFIRDTNNKAKDTRIRIEYSTIEDKYDVKNYDGFDNISNTMTVDYKSLCDYLDILKDSLSSDEYDKFLCVNIMFPMFPTVSCDLETYFTEDFQEKMMRMLDFCIDTYSKWKNGDDSDSDDE